MKTIFLLLLATPIVFLACKKDKVPSKNLYLGKVYNDGLLETEYIYSANKKAIRRNIYGTNTGQSVPFGFQVFDYNANGLLETVTQFSKNNLFLSKYKLQYDQNKRVTRMDDLMNDNTLHYYYVFDYNASGDMTIFTLYTAANQKNAEGIFTYSGPQKLTKMIRRSYTSNPSYLIDSNTFSFNGKVLPGHWNYFEQNPTVSLPFGDRLFADMTCDNSFTYAPDTPARKTTYTTSGREYNQGGYLTKQLITKKFEQNSISSASYQMTYEYIE